MKRGKRELEGEERILWGKVARTVRALPGRMEELLPFEETYGEPKAPEKPEIPGRMMIEAVSTPGNEVRNPAKHLHHPLEKPVKRKLSRGALALEARIDLLPDAFRTVFMLRAVEDWTVEEVAQALEIPEATVRTRYFRARSLLREGLASAIDMTLPDAFAFDGARCDRIVAAVLAHATHAPSSLNRT